jgi:hypothetical protein
VSSIVIENVGALLSGDGWKRVPVFPRLMVRANHLAAAENLFNIICRSLDKRTITSK